MQIDEALLKIFLAELDGYVEALTSSDTNIIEKSEAAHGMKGASAMLEFSGLSSLAARLETILKKGEQDPEIVAAIQAQVTDIASGAVASDSKQDGDSGPSPVASAPAAEATQPSQQTAATSSQATLASPMGQNPTIGDSPAQPIAENDQSSQDELGWDQETMDLLLGVFQEESTEHIETMASALDRLNQDPTDPESIKALFRGAHTIKGAAGTVGLGQLGDAAHLFETFLETPRRRGRILDEELQTATWALDALQSLAAKPTDTSLLNAFRQQISSPQASRPLAGSKPQPLDGQDASDDAKTDGGAIADSSTTYQPQDERRADSRRAAERRDSDRRIVRVDVDHVDSLMDLLAELVFARTRIQRRSEEMAALVTDLKRSHHAYRDVLSTHEDNLDHRLPEVEIELADETANLGRAVEGLTEEAEWLRRLTISLQEQLIRLRMQPIKHLMMRLKRAATDLSHAQGKEVNVVIEGEESNLDKSVADRLMDPMIHIVRNAVGHGIEHPSRRMSLGKPRQGTLRIAARELGDYVQIEVSDDGAGIDPATIREAAVRHGFLSRRDAEKLDDKALLNAIFRPGFTTKKQADKVAGRGVGLDVVHRVVRSMAGDVQVASEPGKGTTFSVRLPLLAAISNALLFKVGGEVYALSVAHVEETRLITKDSHSDLDMPILNLANTLGVESRRRTRHVPGFVVRWEDRRFMVICDKLVGPRQIVVRPMSPLIAPVTLYSGTTISGSGKVQLVLDPAALAERVGQRPRLKHDTIRRHHVPRVLVCDDSRSVREVLVRILQEAGYEVEPAVDGWDAWERMLHTKVDALLTDLEMPRMDGYMLIERLRRVDQFKSLPIIVLTSRTGPSNRTKADSAGANDFLTKPIKKRMILDVLKKAIPV